MYSCTSPQLTYSVVGRDIERGIIEATLGRRARGGLTACVIEGDPGIGKTTLWRSATQSAIDNGQLVLTARPTVAERGLPFAAVGDLLQPLEPSRFAVLPTPQRSAIDVALLRGSGGPRTDVRAVGRALITLIEAMVADRPVVFAIDDIQWLDVASARTLSFALRRAEGLPVTVIATRRPNEDSVQLLRDIPAARIHTIPVGSLSQDALDEIIVDRVGALLTRSQRTRIAAATKGNPSHAIEVAAAIAGANAPEATLPISHDLRSRAASRMRRLPHETRAALLRASALAHPSTRLVDASALVLAEDAQLVRIRHTGAIEFTHPLFAEAIYRAAPPTERRALHAELAGVVDDSEVAAHHLALAGNGPDERVAQALDAAADRARRRGAPDMAAGHAFHAARRTASHAPDRRDARLMAAGRDHLATGDVRRAGELARAVIATQPVGDLRAQACYLEAQTLAFASPTAPLTALITALDLAGNDPDLAARIEIAFAMATLGVGDPLAARDHLDHAIALVATGALTGTLAEALAYRDLAGIFIGTRVDGATLERPLGLENRDNPASHLLRPTLVVAVSLFFTGDISRARELLTEHLEWVSHRGEESARPWILMYLASVCLFTGDLDEAWRWSREASRAALMMGSHIHPPWIRAVQAMIAAIRGDADAGTIGEEALDGCEQVGWPEGARQARWALALSALTDGDPRRAVALLDGDVRSIEQAQVFEWPVAFCLPEAIEALAAVGDLSRAGRLADDLAAWGDSGDRPWAAATGARGRAIVAAARGELDEALRATDEALMAHTRIDMPFERARTLLVRGQIERRLKRRAASRRTLDDALTVFTRIGARGFADRARTETQRLGGRSKNGDLSATEETVARLAAQGMTNAQIAANMFLSRRTVESNLARAYPKLGVSSRTQLAAKLAAAAVSGLPEPAIP